MLSDSSSESNFLPDGHFSPTAVATNASSKNSTTRPAIKSNGSNHQLKNTDYEIIGSRNSLYGRDQLLAPRGRSGIRVTREEYLKETTVEQRELLRTAINDSLLLLLRNQRAIFLEELGIIHADCINSQRAYIVSCTQGACREELIRRVQFEKCDDSSAIDRNKFPNLVELAEFTSIVQAALPGDLSVLWSDRMLRRNIRGMIKDIREEVVSYGYSKQLSNLGTLSALHNRQGLTSRDWFAGADIFMANPLEERVKVSAPIIFERPVLQNAWELLEAALGEPVHIFSIDVIKELQALGYEMAADATSACKAIKVAAFELPQSQSDEKVYIYCTDGLRKQRAISKERTSDAPEELGAGSEFVFQLAVPQRNLQLVSPEDAQGAPTWPGRPITMAWVLLQSSRSKTLKVGAGLSTDLPLRPRTESDLNTIFVTPFSMARNEMLSEDGPFRYLNILGVSHTEAQLARDVSPDFLINLLERRGLDQITRPSRMPITHRFATAPETNARFNNETGERGLHA